jgi:hypothetical protein
MELATTHIMGVLINAVAECIQNIDELHGNQTAEAPK